MLGDLLPKVPTFHNRYMESFFGGGAMFLHCIQKKELFQGAILNVSIRPV